MEKRLWEIIANQCAPVLMDVKPSNLLILNREEEQAFLREKDKLFGISSLCLYMGEKKSTWILYRKDRLEAELIWPQIKSFLETYEYRPREDSLDEMLQRLKERYTDYREGRLAFPHELGVFLGYPLCDVKGFIEHQGKNYLCSGYWKVYGDEIKAKKTFQLYQAVKDAVLQMLYAGRDLYEISCQAY